MSNLQEILTDPHICGAVCTLVDVLELLTCLVNVLHVLQVQRLKVEIVQAPVNRELAIWLSCSMVQACTSSAKFGALRPVTRLAREVPSVNMHTEN